jgi:hypothetical protein
MNKIARKLQICDALTTLIMDVMHGDFDDKEIWSATRFLRKQSELLIEQMGPQNWLLIHVMKCYEEYTEKLELKLKNMVVLSGEGKQ